MACLLIDKNKAEHGPTKAPLVGAVLKQHNLKERREKRWQQFWALPQVLCKRLHARNTQHFFTMLGLVTITLWESLQSNIAEDDCLDYRQAKMHL